MNVNCLNYLESTRHL